MVPEIWSVTDRMLCHFGPFFALLPLKNLKNQNFEKMKKVPGDVIILHKCTKNHDHMLHCSWDTICDKCNSFFYFGLCFGPLTTQKIKILKKWKKTWRYHHFTQVYQKYWSHDVQFLKYGVQQMDKQPVLS